MLFKRIHDLPLTSETFKIIVFRLIYQGFLSIITVLGFFILSGILFSCSQEKNTFVSKSFHNTTAHYNAYFLAREKMKEVDAQIWKANIDNYNQILSVFPTRTEATANTIKPGADEVIKKASLIHQKHKNSFWLDDGYLIIGKSYLYKNEYKTALTFFKFVNSKTEDPNAKHAALAYLMRTYVDSMDYESAKSVSDYLNKKLKGGESLNKNNLRDFNMSKAHYHQKLEEYQNMLPLLEEAVEEIVHKDERARVHFIIGQLHQKMGNDTSAFKHYRAATKKNPPYELLFHAKLYQTQVASGKGDNSKKMDRYFKQLLADKKNTEYRDKIYYEMGKYELKKGNTPAAISNLEKSIHESSKNIPQKALTYLKLGEIYYDNSVFSKSKLYYDSAVAVWNKEDKRYKEISTRQKVLAEFVGYQETVRREDSLQRLSKLSKAQLEEVIDKVIAQEKEEAKRQEDIQKFNQAKNNSAPDGFEEELTASTFPLTNPQLISAGRIEFRKVWGNRKLTDNWRRSQREINELEEEIANNTTAPVDTASANTNEVEKPVDKTKYYADIPYTKEQLDSSNIRIERGLYNIGKIYNQKLDEPAKSVKTFESLISRFPHSEYIAEAYYFIYLISKNQKDDKNSEAYKRKLLSEYPNSLYAKLIGNPNYLQDNKVANMKAHEQYKQAFDLYKNGNYKGCDSLIQTIRVQFPDNDIADKLSLLQVMSYGQTGSPVIYKAKLEEFIGTYKASLLVPKAEELIAATEKFISGSSGKTITVNESYVKYSTEISDKPHLMVAVLPKKISSSKAKNEFKNFNVSNSDKQPLEVEIIPFTDTTQLIVVKGFGEKFYAQVYLNKIKNPKSFFSNNGYINHPVFIISNPNYQLFRESKNLTGYLEFYKENY